MIKLLHTADLHLGQTFAQFDEHDARKLMRARLSVVEKVLGLADQYNVDVVLCAGDVFDSPDPAEDWWKGLARMLAKRPDWRRPFVLLPGNHDPLVRDSVYDRSHGFRRLLPDWVHVVDRDDFELVMGPEAVLYAAPCRSTAGAEDLTEMLPARTAGDGRIRIGLVHGSTFDLPGFQTNFPISRDACAKRGLDYLAIGDNHGYREIPPGAIAPIVYPGAPEPTSFKDNDSGTVALVTIRRPGSRPQIVREPVAQWTWRDQTVTSLQELRQLAAEDLSATVLRLRLEMTVPLEDGDEVEALVSALTGSLAAHGRAGALVLDRTKLRVEAGQPEMHLHGAPETVRAVAERLAAEAPSSDASRRALLRLYRLFAEQRQCAS